MMKSRYVLSALLLGLGTVGTALLTPGPATAQSTIKFAHNMPPKEDANYHRYFLKFEALATKYTNGAVNFREFPASQMGSDQQAAKKLQLGSLEMMNVAANNLAQLYSGFDLFTLPFLFKSFDCAKEKVLIDDKLMADISQEAQKKANIRVLAFTISGTRNIMNSKRPVNTPADLKGMRIRVAKNPILLDTYAALGADSIGIASAETYGALQTKVVDGHDGASSWAYSQKLYEVQNYVSFTGHQLVVNAVIVNNDFFKKLPKESQEALKRAAKEAAVENMAWMKGFEQKIYDNFKKAGLKFNTPDTQPFREAVRSVWDKYAERVGGMERIKMVQALQTECN